MNRTRVVSFLEALHGETTSLEGWAQGVVDAAQPLLGEGRGVVLWSVDGAAGREVLRAHALGSDTPYEDYRSHATAAASILVGPAFDAFFPDGVCVSLASDRLPLATDGRARGQAERLEGYLLATKKAMLSGDALGLTGRATEDIGVVLTVPQRVRRSPGRAERARLTELSLHVEAALRVRIAPEVVLGTVSPTGRLELAEELPRATRVALGEEVRQIERARTGRRRSDGEGALAVWRALAAGFISLVERVERGGQRRYLLCESPPRKRRFRELTREEATVSLQAARGLTNKTIAYSLGWTESATARRLSRAATKLGLSSPRALVRLLAGLGVAGGAERALDLDALTAAEREVASLLAEGLTNEQIAARRGVATRTIANQVASLLRKTGADGRRVFAAGAG
jgi:DNA-binding NarL/FixJ family response regulator